MNYYDSFFPKKPKFSATFSQENNNLGRLAIGINNAIEANEELYQNISNKALEAENKNNQNFIYEDYNKIVSKKDIFSQFPESINKENIYFGNKLKIGFSKK